MFQFGRWVVEFIAKLSGWTNIIYCHTDYTINYCNLLNISDCTPENTENILPFFYNQMQFVYE